MDLSIAFSHFNRFTHRSRGGLLASAPPVRRLTRVSRYEGTEVQYEHLTSTASLSHKLSFRITKFNTPFHSAKLIGAFSSNKMLCLIFAPCRASRTWHFISSRFKILSTHIVWAYFTTSNERFLLVGDTSVVDTSLSNYFLSIQYLNHNIFKKPIPLLPHPTKSSLSTKSNLSTQQIPPLNIRYHSQIQSKP